MRVRIIASLATMLAASITGAHADEVQWSQILDTPKDLNLPSDVRPDILGIALGDTLSEVRAKLEALDPQAMAASGMAMPDPGDVQAMAQYMALKRAGNDMSAPFNEQIMTLYLQGPTPIEASYISSFTLERTPEGNTTESLTIQFSAPSSGSQVLLVQRHIEYADQASQIRVGELLDAIAAKMGSAPDALDNGAFAYQFDGGSRVPAEGGYDCYYFASTWGDSPNALQNINPEGRCDAAYGIQIAPGMSQDHARAVTFVLYDNERAKANLAADFQFFNDYAAQVQNSTGGATPKL